MATEATRVLQFPRRAEPKKLHTTAVDVQSGVKAISTHPKFARLNLRVLPMPEPARETFDSGNTCSKAN